MAAMQRTRLARLQAMPIYGNAMFDRPLFDLAHEIVMDTTDSFEHRAEAIRVMDRAMGEASPATTEGMEEAIREYVMEYVEECG